MEGDDSDRKSGLIVVKHSKNDGSSVVFAWCSSVGECQILNPNRGDDQHTVSVKKDALVVGQWYSFRLVPHYKRDNQVVAFADEAVPIEPMWPASAKRTCTGGRQVAQVRNVPVLVGAVQKAAGVAVGWSPFFQRIGFEQLKLFNLDHVKTGAMLSVTISYTLVDNDCCWAAVAIDEPLVSNGLEMQVMGVKKIIVEFASFDASKELCWATGENGEKICFGACDFDRQQQQNDAVEFGAGDRFLAWIGERSPFVAYHRAFYVQLLTSMPMPMTKSTKAQQQQQKDTAKARLPTSISPSSIPIASSSPALSISAGHSFTGKETGQKTPQEQWTQTEEAKDDGGQRQLQQKADEQLLSAGRQLYARIMRQKDICGAICQHDPALLSDLFTLFNP